MVANGSTFINHRTNSICNFRCAVIQLSSCWWAWNAGHFLGLRWAGGEVAERLSLVVLFSWPIL